MQKPLVIITGASSGIGAEAAKLFAQAGYKLGLLARNKSAMEALNLPNTICVETDVSDINSVRAAIQIIKKNSGPVDCLINNAGFAKGGEFSELSHDEITQMINVNLAGAMNCIEVILPQMQAQKTGTIINVSSLADRHQRPNIAVYAATKAAIRSLSESLRMANAKHGIRICNIAPAKIETPMLVKNNLNDQQIISVDNMAKTLLWMYQQPQSVCIRDLVIAPTYYEA